MLTLTHSAFLRLHMTSLLLLLLDCDIFISQQAIHWWILSILGIIVKQRHDRNWSLFGKNAKELQLTPGSDAELTRKWRKWRFVDICLWKTKTVDTHWLGYFWKPTNGTLRQIEDRRVVIETLLCVLNELWFKVDVNAERSSISR